MSGRRLYFCIFAALFLVTLSLPVNAEPVTIRILQEQDVNRTAALEAIIEQFMEEHPDIRVEIVGVSGNPVNAMITMYAAGVAPDIGQHDPYVGLEFARQGMIIELNQFLENEPDLLEAIPEPLFQMSVLNGKHYGVPMETQLGTVMYNKQLYDEAGVTYPDPSWTYDDLKEYARRLTLRQADGTATRHGFRIPTTRNWVPAIWAHGGDLMDDWNNPTRFTDDPSALIATIEFYNELVNMGVLQDYSRRSSSYTTSDFVAERVAMIQGNTISLALIHTNAKFDWDVLPLPKGPNDQVGAYINSHQRFIFSTSEHKEEAWQLLRYLASYDAVAERTRRLGTTPIRYDVLQDIWFDLPGGASRHTLFHDIPFARSPWTIPTQLWDAIGPEMERALWGLQAPQIAVERMARQFNAVVSDYRAAYGLD